MMLLCPQNSIIQQGLTIKLIKRSSIKQSILSSIQTSRITRIYRNSAIITVIRWEKSKTNRSLETNINNNIHRFSPNAHLRNKYPLACHLSIHLQSLMKQQIMAVHSSLPQLRLFNPLLSNPPQIANNRSIISIRIGISQQCCPPHLNPGC